MFETSVVRARAATAGNRASVFTISVAAHSAVVIGAIALSIASIDFPPNAPAAYARAVFVEPLPVPPGPAPRPVQRAAAQPPVQRSAAMPAQPTVPTEIPETVTPVAASAGTGDPLAAGGGQPGTGEEGGVSDGVEGGVGSDLLPGVGTATPVTPTIYRVTGEVKAPVLVHKVEPVYPQIFVRSGVPATVVVRCVIDRNGAVRDPEIVVSAAPPFNAAVLDAVRKWRFRPGSLRGEAVEVYLDLTVSFRVTR
jgi:protein TonB